MFRTKESKIAAVILLTFGLLLITGIFPEYVLAGAVIVALAIAALWAYAIVAKKRVGEPKDERSERCSFMAAQYAFMAMIVLTAFVTVAVQMGWLTDAVTGLRSIWLLGIAVYLLLYLAYKRFV